jgi:hypothetical protein
MTSGGREGRVGESANIEHDSIKDDAPTPKQAAAVAGAQFLLAIAVALAVVVPGAIIVFVLLPMGWAATGPLLVLLVAMGCLVQIGRVVLGSRGKSADEKPEH